MRLGLGLAIDQIGGAIQPAWASGVDLWEDFTRAQGPLADPTDTHASTIYAPNAAGVYAPFAANVPVRTNLGLQTVPTRTNSIRNNSNTGAGVGTPGTLPTNWSGGFAAGLTSSVVGFGTDSATGLPYTDVRVSGTTGDATGAQWQFEPATGMAALTGQTWTTSLFLSLVAGSFTNVTSVNIVQFERTAAGAGVLQNIGPNIISSVSAASARFSYAVTLSGGVTTAFLIPRIQFIAASGVAIDFTVRIGATQAEQGAFASAPILTTAAAATVNGNQQVIDLTGRLGTGVAGIVQIDLKETTPANGFRFFEIDDGTDANRVTLAYRSPSTSIQLFVQAASVGQADIATVDTYSSGIKTIAFAASTNYFNARVVGAADPGADNSGTFPSLNRAALGGRGFDTAQNMFCVTKKLAFSFGPQDATTFAAMFARAQIAAVS